MCTCPYLAEQAHLWVQEQKAVATSLRWSCSTLDATCVDTVAPTLMLYGP